MRIALTIAGSDSGGGAGIQADLKTFQQFGVFGTTVVTAVTAQNTVRVASWETVSLELVRQQMQALRDDLPPHAIKTGMLASAELVDVVATGIAEHQFPNYVLDPVMVATSGDRLLNQDAEHRVAAALVPLTTLVTPNIPEAQLLTGRTIESVEQMEDAARAILDMGAAAVLVKGGHLTDDGAELIDLFAVGETVRRFSHHRLTTTSTHGTGCTLSAPRETRQ